jgi:hypothetical protein
MDMLGNYPRQFFLEFKILGQETVDKTPNFKIYKYMLM